MAAVLRKKKPDGETRLRTQAASALVKDDHSEERPALVALVDGTASVAHLFSAGGGER